MKRKYSDWLKIDLHIHTDFSKQTKENDYKGEFSVDKVFEKMVENKVEIFSLTDHNIINVDAYEEYYSKYNSDKAPLLLLGVELDVIVKNEIKDDTKKVPESRKYHTLLIFNVSDIDGVKRIDSLLENKYRDKNFTDKKKRELDIEEIAEVFQSEDFFFIPHADGGNNLVSAYRNNIEYAQRMVLLMHSALEKVTKFERIARYKEGFNRVLTESFRSKEDIPYINFSDNHNISEYPCTHKGGTNNKAHEFHYIKGSKCYESIRLAFIDPASRIKTTEEFKKLNRTNTTLDYLKIEDNEKINNVELNFSPHLNVIIGGRSSGKSLLMWILGNKIETTRINNNYGDDFLENTRIKSNKDIEFKDTTSFENHIYIKQGDITRYFEVGELKELANEVDKEEEYSSAKQAFIEHESELKKTKDEFIAAYDKVFVARQSNSKFILKNYDIEKALSSEYVFKVDNDEVNKRFNNTDELNNASEVLNTLLDKINELEMIKSLLSLNETEKNIIQQFKELIDKKINLIEEEKRRTNKKTNFINDAKKVIIEANGGLNLEAQQKNKSNEDIKNLNITISNLFVNLKNLKKCSDAFENFDNQLEKEIKIADDITLVLEISKKCLKELILDGIKNSDDSISFYLNAYKLINQEISIKNYQDNSSENLKKKIDTQLNEVYWSYHNPTDYLKYRDGETSKENSPGFNSEKYLNVLLNNSQANAIFIDQPEDNLGNHFIAHTLVDDIREQKFEKQIFLVTHNPSIVVYGDAESVILAENEGGKINYKQIVLEDKNAQKEICEILDGGEYIFSNRAKKYDIKRLQKITE
ncbi:MAG: PHP domain-containing protein [Bacteroidales bacterium]